MKKTELTEAQTRALNNISSARVDVLRALKTKGLVTLREERYSSGELMGISAHLTEAGRRLRG